ncbi:MAG: hypothetical protein KGY81_08105 [Phycisphaerae bacterium]|nr:hypothetical protein [Phycisphaerae bacterium]
MSLVLRRIPGEREQHWRSGMTRHKRRRYHVGAFATLADVDCEEGDDYPDDSNYEIVRVTLAPGPGDTKIVDVTGWQKDTV